MPNPQQNKIQNKTEQIKKEINLLQDILKKNEKKSESISKWVNAHQKIRLKKDKGRIFFKANQKEHKSTTKSTCTSKNKKDIV